MLVKLNRLPEVSPPELCIDGQTVPLIYLVEENPA